MNKLINAYMKIIHKIPDYTHGTEKCCKRQIQEILQKYEYDEDFIQNISFEFCKGFGIAKEIILKEIKEEIEKLK